jgi:hypothetical protein
MPEQPHTHTLLWGNHVIADGENGEPRHVKAGETCKPAPDDLLMWPAKFMPILKEKGVPNEPQGN